VGFLLWLVTKAVKKRGQRVVETLTEVNFRSALTHFRACVLILTAVCILAVDFHIFPRRFAKTEIHGVSLMDFGVGAFVFCAALVHPFFRTLLYRRSIESQAWYKHLILLVLGIIRDVVNDSVNYQKHMSEYGRNWNFFITFGAVSLVLSLLHWMITPTVSVRRKDNTPAISVSGVWLGLCLATTLGLAMLGIQTGFLLHQQEFTVCMASQPGEQKKLMSGLDYVLHDGTRFIQDCRGKLPTGHSPLSFWIAANREGLVSLPGYIALACFTIVAMLPMLSIAENTEPARGQNLTRESGRVYFNFRITAWMLGFLLFLGICGHLVPTESNIALLIRVSRRLCNIGYIFVILVAGIILLFLQSWSFGDPRGLKRGYQPTKLHTLVNRNAMIYFIGSNLLTGLVNLSMNTMTTSDFNAFFILLGYFCLTFLFPYAQSLMQSQS